MKYTRLDKQKHIRYQSYYQVVTRNHCIPKRSLRDAIGFMNRYIRDCKGKDEYDPPVIQKVSVETIFRAK
jgi:hypothetical protein